MTVRELIEELRELDLNSKVIFRTEEVTSVYQVNADMVALYTEDPQ